MSRVVVVVAAGIVLLLCVYGLLACLGVSVFKVIDEWRGRRRV